MDIKEELSALPKAWGYVAVKNKRPYQNDWQNNPLKKSELIKELVAKRSTGIGVCCGVPSGGLLFLDHDGPSAAKILGEWGFSLSSLPPSWMVTSGRVGRFQIIYQVPQKYWSKIKTRKFQTGVKDEDGSVEQIELRWNGTQSIVSGSHPMTDGYRWMDGRSPRDIKEIAEAPIAIIEKMMEPKKKKTPQIQTLNSDTDKARSLLQSINPNRLDDYDDWLKIGMAAHSVGDNSLLHDWEQLSQKNSKYQSGECEKKWQSFKSSGVSLGTLQKFASEDGWTPPPRSFPTSIKPAEEPTPVPRKLEQLTSQELINFLRNLKQEIRFNTFSHSIEMDGKVIKNIELFYLTLAELGYKVPKEMAIDCLLKVAHENEYDPVKLYLDHCYNEIQPTYIDRLASTYLRPQDQNLKEPTIYDVMLKLTLINAVRRVYIPGCKHDSATVLQGSQGIKKSSFWQTLFGPFFSDALGDISSKDDLLVLHRSWGMEWSEIDGVTSRKHAGTIKAFLSRSTDLLRVPYGKAVEEWPRRGIIVGSTNKESGLLIDDTGNRRFHIIPCTTKSIDLDSLQLERDSIWSAAVHAFKNKESHFLSFEQENQIEKENLGYMVDSPWLSVITKYLNDPANAVKDITIELLLTEAVEKPIERQTKSDIMTVSSILKSLQYERKRKRLEGTPKWVWFPPVLTPVLTTGNAQNP
jgi:predicted P-loop ATPase